MTASETLERLERIVDAAAVAGRVEALLPVGVRPRQLRVRTLLTGMLLVAVEHRPAHLTGVHQALLSLSEEHRARLGIFAEWSTGPHLLTYRQTERNKPEEDEVEHGRVVPVEARLDDLRVAEAGDQADRFEDQVDDESCEDHRRVERHPDEGGDLQPVVLAVDVEDREDDQVGGDEREHAAERDPAVPEHGRERDVADRAYERDHRDERSVQRAPDRRQSAVVREEQRAAAGCSN
jgi:hypothetical protein